MKATRTESVIVTPATAEKWLSQAMYERQRRRTEWQVERLATEMRKGRFIVGTQIHFGVLNGALKLINGQHTLAAIVRSRTPIELTILYTEVESTAELGELYGRHDRHRGRTPHDAFLGMGLAGELGLEEQEVNALAPAIKWVVSDFRRPSVLVNPEIASLDWLADQMRRWAPHALKYFDCVRGARHGMKGAFRRAPVVAIGLVTILNCEDRAKEFWTGAAEDDGLHRLDPRKALNQFLLQNPSGRGDTVMYMRHVASAWNKFYDSGELQFLRPGDVGKVGITIRGTSHKAARIAARNPIPPSGVDDPPATPPRQEEFGEAPL